MEADKKTLERDYGVVCEIHKNNTNWVVPENAGNNHLHCRPVEELPDPLDDPEWVKVHHEINPPVRPRKKNVGYDQQEKIDYAWEYSKDPDFIYLLEAENGLWTADRRHNPINNTSGVDYGLCGLNTTWFSDIIFAENDRFFWDWKWQIRECYKLYTGGTRFYGRDRKNEVKDNFEWI